MNLKAKLKKKRNGDIMYENVDIAWDLMLEGRIKDDLDKASLRKMEIEAGTYYAKFARHRAFLNDDQAIGKSWMACSAMVFAPNQKTFKQSLKTKYDFYYWVNYGDQSVYGSFSVEQIQQWLENDKVLLADLGGTDERPDRTTEIRKIYETR